MERFIFFLDITCYFCSCYVVIRNLIALYCFHIKLYHDIQFMYLYDTSRYFRNIYAVKVPLCCSILADDRCFVLRLHLVFFRSVKFHTSQYLTTEALAPESQYVPRRVPKLCTCITNQFYFFVLVVL